MKLSLTDAVARAGALASGPGRVMLGITGAPGVGKSTFAAHLVEQVRGAVVLPMDGFHLAQRELVRLGRAGRKGAPDTFDGDGFVSALRRVRAGQGVYAPVFDRALEEPIAGALHIPAKAPLVIVEGNYLLLEQEPWAQVAGLCGETWFLTADEDVRRSRLTARHIQFGRDPDAAANWVTHVDEPNAATITAGLARADVVVRMP